jgi:hypothetical protein
MSEFSLVVKATVIVAIGLGTAATARQARASVRHILLASTFVALLLLPAFGRRARISKGDCMCRRISAALLAVCLFCLQ